jgi:hypothetical protein
MVWCGVVWRVQVLSMSGEGGEGVPADPEQQLRMVLRTLYCSWFSPRYRPPPLPKCLPACLLFTHVCLLPTPACLLPLPACLSPGLQGHFLAGPSFLS